MTPYTLIPGPGDRGEHPDYYASADDSGWVECPCCGDSKALRDDCEFCEGEGGFDGPEGPPISERDWIARMEREADEFAREAAFEDRIFSGGW